MKSRALAVLVLAALLGASRPAHAQTAATDLNREHPTHVVTVARDGYTISGLLTHLQDARAFRHAVALFPGHPGIMRLRLEENEPRFGLAGNFLVRSRRHWLDAETLAIVVDAPSDQSGSFSQSFRETPRYGEDVAALLREVSRRYGVEDWTFVGTSEGSISAFHAARMNAQLARRAILTASVFRPSKNGAGLSRAKWDELAAELLWVHHEDDPCPFTAYRDAQEFARRSGKPLLTVRGGGPPRGEACQAQTAHGFVGVERETVMAMRSWVKTGAVPPDFGR